MGTLLRVIARIALVALALSFVTPLVGVTLSGGFATALGTAAVFEIVCWLIGSGLAFAITSFGGSKDQVLIPLVAFTGIWTVALKLAASLAPAFIAVAGWSSAFFATLILLVISAVTTWRRKTSCCASKGAGK